MPKPLSNDIRIRVVQAYEAGETSYREVSQRFGVSLNSAVRWVALSRQQGDVSPKPSGSKLPPKISDEQLEKLRALVAEKPDRTLVELSDIWNQLTGSDVHRSSMDRALKRANISRKKNFSSFGAFASRYY